MPIVVTCPGCPTKLSAPDSAAGKQVRCPKCGTPAPVPAFVPAEEQPIVDAIPAPPKPKPKAKPVELDDDDDRPRKKPRRDETDDEDERPRKKKRRDDDDEPPRRRRRKGAGGASGGGGKIAIIALVGVLVLAGVGVGIYLLVGKSASAKKSPVPPGWQQYTYEQDGLKLYLPKSPSFSGDTVNNFGGGFGGARGQFGMGGFGGGDLRDADRFATLRSGDWNDPVRVELYAIRFSNKVPSSVRDSLRKTADGPFGGDEMRTVKWLGYDAIEHTMLGGTTRLVYTDRHFLMATITGTNGGRAKPEEEAGFFDNIELTK